MNDYKLSITESIKFGWNTTKKHFPFLIGVLILYAIIHFALRFVCSSLGITFGVLTSMFFGENLIFRLIMLGFLFLLIFILGLFVNIILRTGLLKIMINFVSKEKSTSATLFSQYKVFFKFLGGMIFYGIIVFLGLILFIIPGIILAIKYFFFSYFIVDKKMSPYNALKKSAEITKGNKWNVFFLIVLTILINILGTMLFLVGLLFTIPITKLAFAYAYKKLVYLNQKKVSSEKKLKKQEKKKSRKKIPNKKKVVKKKGNKKKVVAKKKTSKKKLTKKKTSKKKTK